MRLMDHMNMKVYGMSVPEAQYKKICIRCKEPVRDKLNTKVANAEYNISALCNDCAVEVCGACDN